MFGESDSESPRVPSPWDSLTPLQGTPKLIPEAEEGNVEYKLQLLSPTPARFARLVTQLKWRLLEGGGRAYYELGVADSGLLVGLPRQQLEESLETLEMMAGEIGASVIVVKEIEVHPKLSSLAESQLERWDGGKGTRKVVIAPTAEFPNDDVTDAEESTSCSPFTPPTSLEEETNIQVRTCTTPLPFDPALPIFTMDMGDDADEGSDVDGAGYRFSASLEISTVYKPRPMKKCATRITSSSPIPYTKKKLKNDYSPSKRTDTTSHTEEPTSQDSSESHSQSTSAKASRKDKRNKRRELTDNTLSTHVPSHCDESPADSVPCHATPPDSSNPNSPHLAAVDLATGDDAGISASKEPRFIVEALVVWELSVDEAFLDFESFSLQ